MLPGTELTRGGPQDSVVPDALGSVVRSMAPPPQLLEGALNSEHPLGISSWKQEIETAPHAPLVWSALKMPPEEKLKTETPQHKVGRGISGCTSAPLGRECGSWTMQDSGVTKDEERRASGKLVTEGLGQLCLVPHPEKRKGKKVSGGVGGKKNGKKDKGP